MSWSDVGQWVKDNAGTSAALVGSLLTGNIPAAVATGVSLVSSATGSDDPATVLRSLQQDPQTVVRLRELAVENEQSIREHIREIHRLNLEDKQAAHKETQSTIRDGDKAEDQFVRRTRPAQSWISLIGALFYVFYTTASDIQTDPVILGALLTLPWAYAGLRQIGKGIDSLSQVKIKS